MTAESAPGPAPVIVVDDDDAVQKSLKFMLELEGLDVRVYGSAEALLAERDLPSRGCLVVDQKMPRMSGVELIKRLKSRNVGLPAILITARLTADVASKATEAGVSAIFEKPLQDAGLIDAIRHALAVI